MPGSVGPLEIGIVLVIALIVFGPKKLPEFGSGLGRGMREFKESITGEKREKDSEPKELASPQPVSTSAGQAESSSGSKS